MQTTLTFLTPPKNQTCKILKALIEGKTLTEQQVGYNGFRTRISELKRLYNVPLHWAWKKFTNEFGEESQCKAHFLLQVDHDLAIEVYERLNK
jgi:hypothetical protein